MNPEPQTQLLDSRHQWLLDRLEHDRALETNASAAELGVSVDTIRRDLRLLHDRGLLRRVHGGAVRLSPLAPSFSGRANEDSSERTRLAHAVVERLKPGQVLGLDAGTTTTEIAAQLPQSLAVTIVTNNPAAALALADHRSARAILVGGHLDLQWMATTGAEAVDAIRNHHLDLAVVGACSFDPTGGATTRSQHEVATKQAFLSAAAETVMPLEASKLSSIAPFRIAPATAPEILVTDGALDRKTAKQWRKAGVRLTISDT